LGQGVTLRAGDYIFSVEKENKIVNWEQDFLYITEKYQQLTVSVSDRLSRTILRCRWCNIIVSSTHAKREKKSDDSYMREFSGFKAGFRSFSNV
jgi:hypothetical protein